MRERVLFQKNEGFALLLLGIVITILAGLLAMHTLTSTMGNHDGDRSGQTAMAVGTEHTTEAGTSDPGNGMPTMQCVLALVAAPLATVASCASNRVELIAPAAHRDKRLTAANSRDFERPPDLTDLSISRT